MTQKMADMCLDLYESLLDNGYSREECLERIAMSSGETEEEIAEAIGLNVKDG